MPDDFVKADAGGGGAGNAGGAGGTGGDVVAPSARSCMSPAPAHDLCGRANNEDCCATLLVPGGKFIRGYDNVNFTDDTAVATVSPFFLDKYEVTVARFREWVMSGDKPSQGNGAHPSEPNSGWDPIWNVLIPDGPSAFTQQFMQCDPTYTFWSAMPVSPSMEALPINCISWYMAQGFCIWDGGRLPSEAEWSFAAAGGDEQRVFPWSDPPTSQTIDTTYAVWGCDIMGICAADEAVSIPGSRLPDGGGRWGHADLAGNQVEWILDAKWWNDNLGVPTAITYDLPCTDCVGLDGGNDNPEMHRVQKGGAFFSTQVSDMWSSTHFSRFDEDIGFGSGIRCARDIPSE